MDSNFAKTVLNIAQETHEAAKNLYKPPLEFTPSRSEGVLPVNLFRNTRGYLIKIVQQVNRTYEHSCYDACAVMIRRLVEVLIIETFEKHGMESKIKNSSTGDFFYLQDLVRITLDETAWSLGRNTKQALPKVKNIGDKSAHSRRYNAQRSDIDSILPDLRSISEEFLYISGLKT